MFLVTMIHTNAGCRLWRKVFTNPEEMEAYCDYHFNLGWTIWEVANVDTTLSDMFCTDPV